MSTSNESGSLYGKAMGAGLMGLAGLAAQGLLTTTAQAVTVQGWDLKSAKKVFESPPLAPEFKFGVNIAAGDLDGDGRAEIIAGSSVDRLSYIKFDGVDLAIHKDHKMESWMGGVRVATGDLDGDGAVDLVVSPADGEGAKIRASSGPYLKITLKEVFVSSFAHKMSGGVHATVGHFKIGFEDTLVVGSSASLPDATGARPPSSIRRASVDIASLNQSQGDLADHIKFREPQAVYGEQYSGGIRVAAGDVNGDGIDELLTLNESGPRRSLNFMKYEDSVDGGYFKGGEIQKERIIITENASETTSFSIACGDLDGDGRAEVIVGAGPGGGPHVRVFSFVESAPTFGNTEGEGAWQLMETLTPYGLSYTGGFNLAVGDLDGVGDNELIIASASFVPEPATLGVVIGAAGFLARRRRRDILKQ
jgi:FG-GAP repeat